MADNDNTLTPELSDELDLELGLSAPLGTQPGSVPTWCSDPVPGKALG